MSHSKAWLVDDYRDPALETKITTTLTGAATWDLLFEPDPKMDIWTVTRARKKVCAYPLTQLAYAEKLCLLKRSFRYNRSIASCYDLKTCRELLCGYGHPQKEPARKR